MQEFKHSIDELGGYERTTLQTEDGRTRLQVVPEVGGILTELILDGQSVLDGCKNAQELDHNMWAKSAFLLPFPNRLKDGEYEWNGTTHEWPINDPVNGNALHGFGEPLEFIETNVQLGAGVARLYCEAAYNEDFSFYPFSFRVSVEYRLKAPASFSLKVVIENTGAERMPIGFGWHPYFDLGQPVDELLLELPDCHLVGVDERMVPTGKRYAYGLYEQPKAIGAGVLDNCFAVADQMGGKTNLRLISQKGTLRYWQETGPGKFNYFQIFTPPDRNALALEPMTCNVNAFQNQDGLLALESGQRCAATCGLEWEQAK